MNDIERYENSVRILADNRIGDVLLNKGEDHAKIIFYNLFRIAESTVRIFAVDLSGDVPNSDEYTTQLREFLKRKGRAHILLEQTPDITKSVFGILCEFADQVSIKTTTLRPKIGDGEINFCAADDFAYRIETDKVKCEAHVSFNDKKQTSELKRVFDLMFTDEKSITFNL